jgi:hypothetical protein
MAAWRGSVYTVGIPSTISLINKNGYCTFLRVVHVEEVRGEQASTAE